MNTISSIYNIEIEKVIQEITKSVPKPKTICLQFPDGIKHLSKQVVDEIQEKTKVKCFIYFGTCYGACDIPLNLQNKIDLLIQFGHSRFIKNPKAWSEGE